VSERENKKLKMIKYFPLQVNFKRGKKIPRRLLLPQPSARCFTKKLNTQFTININRKK
jgi:hypothetical protein